MHTIFEKARAAHGTGAYDDATLEFLFPELKESEDERIRKAICHVLNNADYGIIDQTDYTISEMEAYLEKQKEQKSVEYPEKDNRYWFGFNEGKGVVLDNPEEYGLCKPAEWSEEDEEMLDAMIDIVSNSLYEPLCPREGMLAWLKSLRPQPKQEGEPMEIKFAGKIYKVYGTKELPGGGVGYIIEDEPGHYDCIIHPEEVLGGGYGIKSHGSPYPTKGTNFSQPHWKPSEEQLSILGKVFAGCELNTTEIDSMVDLFYNLKQML